ncbi:prepilin-type N-terminal cleavage/methylation domain-containing protein [Melghirimyces profundicolus]|uniref:Prepilin-type N-terminal cleavage/methylation domain-containing protein n=1 Tax=Melghirimyces profundicolus TaxID=1242148 RepID=A0A2T6C9L8_9BACL|nr:prepilin-type N-terminal cleavage/methylation domain-containing protein [Melghirimyces profundicolus]PTX65025.1 prepilin-type N-terminal cleavage/methylation domain-containing protein [Melghirimyces profundicolus]
MIRGEKGFTLAETVTALMVFGVLLSVVLPLLGELKVQHRMNARKMEAVLLLQSEMERLQTVPGPSEGSRKEKSEGTVYRLRWEKKKVAPHLAGTYVEVVWNDAGKKERKRSLKTLNYTH